jgi:hypothetical protein
MKKLKCLLLEYEDGTQTRMGMDNIDAGLQLALAKSGLCCSPPEISSAKHFLILQWRDGWQEVVSINSDVASLLRYYVIRRIEDRGRLALDVGTEYPQLLIIERIPREIDRILLVSDSGVKSYGLHIELEGYEGTFEAGGKREYLKYDSSNPRFQSEFSETPESITHIESAVAGMLSEKGLRPDELLSLEEGQRLQEYKDIARVVGIRGAERQSDVYGLIELILRNLTNNVNREGEWDSLKT